MATCVVFDVELIDRAAAMAPKLSATIHGLRDCAIVTDIRSIGLMAAIQVAPLNNAPGARGHEAQKRLFDTGLNLKSTGDALIIAPPFVMDDTHLDEIVTKLRGVVATL